MKFTNLEKLLPVGYLILVILGIVKESVIYYQLGINILKYSNIMDVLISPISDLTAHPIVLFAFSFYIFLLYLMLRYMASHTDKAWAKKGLGIQPEEFPLSKEDLKIRVGTKFLHTVAFGVMTFFLGIGIGNGKKIKGYIENDTMKFQHVLTFDAENKKKVFLIGINSSNYIYVEEGTKNIKISPIGAVRAIEYLKK